MKWNDGIVNWNWDKIWDRVKTIGFDIFATAIVTYFMHFVFYYPLIIILTIATMSIIVRTGLDTIIREWLDNRA
jgi:hypothetical protein